MLKLKEGQTIGQLALELLSPIPEEKFITGVFTNRSDSCCALGHFHRLTSPNPKDYSLWNCINPHEGLDLRSVTAKFLRKTHNTGGLDIAIVNNKPDVNGYTEEDPKSRVIHLLQDMVKAGY